MKAPTGRKMPPPTGCKQEVSPRRPDEDEFRRTGRVQARFWATLGDVALIEAFAVPVKDCDEPVSATRAYRTVVECAPMPRDPPMNCPMYTSPA